MTKFLDGSETTEDQQLLDSAPGEYATVVEAPPQFSYGTYYDHSTGYYYEYPMMLVGPAVPEHVPTSMMTTMSCAPVPLRPVEWMSPTYTPKLPTQQYCLMDYQVSKKFYIVIQTNKLDYYFIFFIYKNPACQITT